MKKMFSLVLSLALVLAMGIPAYATEAPERANVEMDEVERLLLTYDYSKSLERAANGYIDERVSSDVLDRIRVTGADSYSVELVGTISGNSRSGDQGGNVYSITAEKSVADRSLEDNVETVITMVWIDNPGTTNTLYRIYGGWNANGRTLSNRLVTYGWNNITDSYYTGMRPTDNHFDFYPLDIEGFQLSAIASVNSSGYENNPIMLEVSSSMFQ